VVSDFPEPYYCARVGTNVLATVKVFQFLGLFLQSICFTVVVDKPDETAPSVPDFPVKEVKYGVYFSFFEIATNTAR